MRCPKITDAGQYQSLYSLLNLVLTLFLETHGIKSSLPNHFPSILSSLFPVFTL